MTRQGRGFNLRSGIAITAVFTSGLPLLQAVPAQASPIVSVSSQAQPSPIAAPTDTLSRASSSATVAVTVPNLPPLGEPEPFLPVPDEQTIQLVIRLSERRVYVYDREQVVTSYPIAIGRSGWETPTGEFKVMQMLSNPTWEHPFTGELVPPGAENP